MNAPDPVTEAQHAAPSTGERLRAARTTRGWSVQEVASRLRIRPLLVEALERDDYAAFPAAAYARGQLRNYARLVGLDERAAIEQCQAPAPGAHRTALRRAPELHPRRPWMVRLGGLVIVGVLVILGALWADADRRSGEPGPAVQAPAESPALPTPDEAAPPAPAPAEPIDQSQSTAPLAPTDSPPGQTPGAPLPVEPGPASAVTAPPAAPAEPAEAPAPASPLSGAELRLRSRAVSWVEVTDRSGQRLIYELVSPDRERVVRGEPPLRLLLGNAPSVEVVFDGQPVALPPGQHVVRLTLGTAAPQDGAAPVPNP